MTDTGPATFGVPDPAPPRLSAPPLPGAHPAAPRFAVHGDEQLLAASVAGMFLDRLARVQQARPVVHVVLTGGGLGTAVLAAIAENPGTAVVDWSRVHIWWGDERFLPQGHPDRNATQAYAALLDGLPLSPACVHPMPASDGVDGPDVAAAARRYAQELAAHAEAPSQPHTPRFDLLLLGVGPDGHVASLFPGRPDLTVTAPDAATVPVQDSPKPPPVRISLTLPAITRARAVWLLAAGAGKAEAVHRALAGADPIDVPAAGAHGDETIWFLDRHAAGDHVPPGP